MTGFVAVVTKSSLCPILLFVLDEGQNFSLSFMPNFLRSCMALDHGQDLSLSAASFLGLSEMGAVTCWWSLGVRGILGGGGNLRDRAACGKPEKLYG